MENTANRSVAVGKVARVEICGCGGSLVLSLGALSLRLDFEAAADVAATLDVALARAARAHDEQAALCADPPEDSN